MKKKIVALCGSARKNGNSARMLSSFLKGVCSRGEFEIREVNLFELDYKGCRGCLGCNLKDREENGCVQRDGAYQLLRDMRRADGIVFASPVYFWELSSRTRAVWERFLYPGSLSHHREIEAIYTMFQPREVSRWAFPYHADTVKTVSEMFLGDINYCQLIINQTIGWDEDRADTLDMAKEEIERQKAVKRSRWDKDLRRAMEEGQKFAERILNSSV